MKTNSLRITRVIYNKPYAIIFSIFITSSINTRMRYILSRACNLYQRGNKLIKKICITRLWKKNATLITQSKWAVENPVNATANHLLNAKTAFDMHLFVIPKRNPKFKLNFLVTFNFALHTVGVKLSYAQIVNI